MSTSAFGIDLGTYNIKIYNGFNDTISSQKNIIAIQKIMNKKNLFAYGDHAFEMYEKAPQNITVSFPVMNGVIADINHMQVLLRNFINDAMNGNIKGADFYISVPTDITEVEKRAFFDLVRESNVKARNIYIVEKAIADGVGLDVDVINSQGILVVNIGYETIEISILSMGGIVLSRLIKIGGKRFAHSAKAADKRVLSPQRRRQLAHGDFEENLLGLEIRLVEFLKNGHGDGARFAVALIHE